MTVEQATLLIQRLEHAYDKKLHPERFRIYVEKLKSVPYERGHRGVDQCIEQERLFPTVATLLQHCENVGLDGVPNALAYYTGPQRSYQEHMARARAALEWNDRLVEMSDEEYHEYLTRLMRRKQLRREAV